MVPLLEAKQYCFDFKQPEFHFKNKYNNLGFIDKDRVKEKPDSIKRLIVLGDSFTEGDGAVRDSAFPSFLETTLKNKYRNSTLSDKSKIYPQEVTLTLENVDIDLV